MAKVCVFVLNFNNPVGSCMPDQHKNSYTHCICISFGKPWNDDVDYSLMMLGKLIKKML